MKPIQTVYKFVENRSPVNLAAKLPLRPSFEANRSLEKVLEDEIGCLAKGAPVSKETRIGVGLGAIARGNYQADIQLGERLSKFFNRQRFSARDIFVHNSPMNGQIYEGGKIESAITSSFNRVADTVTLLRKVEGAQNEGYCYAGRVDTVEKAEEVARMIFIGELESGRGIEKKGDLYKLQFGVQSLIGSALFPSRERKMLKDEIRAYQELTKKTLEITHPITGKRYQVQVLEPIFSHTQFNWINQISSLTDSDVMGDDLAKEISSKGDAILFEKAKDNAPAMKIAERLRSGNLKPWEEILLRAHLCYLLKIPELVHCKSSVDRTGVAVALISTMRNYLESGKEIVVDEWVMDKDGNKIYPFKELFAAHLRKGLIQTELSRGKEGYKLNRGWCQSLALQDLLPERFLKEAPKQTMMKTVIRISCFIFSLFLIIATLGGLLKAICLKSLKGFDVWTNPLKAFRPNAFPKYVVDETTSFGQGLLLFNHAAP
jgi:hypothetical protein